MDSQPLLDSNSPGLNAVSWIHAVLNKSSEIALFLSLLPLTTGSVVSSLGNSSSAVWQAHCRQQC